MILMWWIASTLMWIAIFLLLIVVVFLAGYYLYKKRGVSESRGATPTPAKNFFKELAKGKHQEEWWFPAGVAFVSYAVVLFFSSILLPEEIWHFWKETKLCWWLFAIIPIFVLGMKRGGIAGKIGATILVIISIVYLLNDKGFNSTFGESEVDKQAKIAAEEVARQQSVSSSTLSGIGIGGSYQVSVKPDSWLTIPAIPGTHTYFSRVYSYQKYAVCYDGTDCYAIYPKEEVEKLQGEKILTVHGRNTKIVTSTLLDYQARMSEFISLEDEPVVLQVVQK